MTILNVEISEETFARLEDEARRRGVDVATYVRRVLDQVTNAGGEAVRQPRTDPREAELREGSADSEGQLDSPEAVVAWIRAHRGTPLAVRDARADLANLLASGGVDQGVPLDIWEHRWVAHEEAAKAAELADEERALRELRALLGGDRVG